jgi:hypothetical protein
VNAVVEIGTDKRLREALGEKARAVTVHGFDMDVMKHEYQRFYKGIAG